MLRPEDVFVGNTIEFTTGTKWIITEVFLRGDVNFTVALDGINHPPVRRYCGSYESWKLVTPSIITVSSLDYQSNDELDDKDKEIIKEYLDGCH